MAHLDAVRLFDDDALRFGWVERVLRDGHGHDGAVGNGRHVVHQSAQEAESGKFQLYSSTAVGDVTDTFGYPLANPFRTGAPFIRLAA